MANLNPNDIGMMYAESVVLYKGKLVYFKSVNADFKTYIIDLETGKPSYPQFNQVDFKAPVGRIGYINHNGHAIYASRMPVRKFSVGLTKHNIQLKYITEHRYHHSLVRCMDQLYTLKVKSLYDAYTNQYPKLSEAIRIANVSEGSCAFDKQFAVSFDRKIYFKNEEVGSIDGRYSTVKRITFKPGFEFLEILVEPNYEKTVRTFKTA